ncbi:4251_t:CDS:2 [Funneliformis mosseae]|uniref:4251_t:CDS:1 n=1 Tax=Funneliformis mosseae TaxID=27381 RepID=A0A9N8V382_FUNMO|nr:4251_t:CDS:2 [Funneliformis mosseae]
MATYERIEIELEKARGDYEKAEKNLQTFEEGEDDGKWLKELRNKVRRSNISEEEKRQLVRLEEEKEKLETTKMKWDDQVIKLQAKLVEFNNEKEQDKDRRSVNLNKFWKNLKDAKITVPGNFLQLPGNTHFLGEPLEPTTIYIRRCYRDLADIAFNREIQRLRITGNPGIGKTLFGYYLLYLLAIEKKTIIYDNNATDDWIVFDKEEVFYIDDKSVIKQYQSNPEVWYIVDGKEPKRVNAKTILVCSPRKDHYRNFDKYIGTTIRYMPVWTWEEINI